MFRSLRTVLAVWMDTYPDDFREPLDYPTLNSILQFSLDSAFDNELAQKARELLSELKRSEEVDHAGSGLGQLVVSIYGCVMLLYTRCISFLFRTFRNTANTILKKQSDHLSDTKA